MKKKKIQKPKTHVITSEPDDITLELAKTMAEIKEDYDLPTEEVAKTVATKNNNRFRNIFKKLLDSWISTTVIINYASRNSNSF